MEWIQRFRRWAKSLIALLTKFVENHKIMAESATTLSEALEIYNDRFQDALQSNSKRLLEKYQSKINQINAYYDIVGIAVGEGDTTRAQEALDAIVSILASEGITISEEVTPPMGIGVYASPNSILIPVDSDGTNPVYDNAESTVSIFLGALDYTDSWSYAIETLTNVNATIVLGVVTITEITADEGSVLVRSTREGYSDIDIEIVVKKLFKGESGDAGTSGVIQNANLSLQPQDEGTVVGNARGASSVDYQTLKINPDEVASGESSVIGGGRYNIASGDNSVVGGGVDNNAYESNATIAGGRSNNAASKAFVGGGSSNDALGDNSTICGGDGNNIDSTATYAIIGGGLSNDADGISSGVFSGQGNEAAEQFSMVLGGINNTASAQFSTVLHGTFAEANGSQSLVSGYLNKAETYSEIVFGYAALEVAGTPDSWISTDPLFRIGNGTGASSRSDAFRINKDGSVFMYGLKSGISQVDAGASANELWIDTADNSIKIGV